MILSASYFEGQFDPWEKWFSILRANCLSFGLSESGFKNGGVIMIGLLGILIIGLVVGAIAKLIVPGKEPGGCLITMAIGVAGSFVAFYLGRLLGWTSGNPDSLRPVGFFPSLLGAVILLLVYNWIRRRSGR
jgi:uncharacterized membrane protein YeaQ/YmgE (transglycosylase-associated protein family)